MVLVFPPLGPLIRLALRELDIAAHGTAEQRNKLGDPALLPRPWEPATCRQEALRAEVWAWLERVVDWLTHEHVWDITTGVPPCWPQHPDLVHQIAVLADQRRRAGDALISDPLEEWHRYALPSFWDRVRQSVRGHCDDGHQPWPAAGRFIRHVNDARPRVRTYTGDVRTLGPASARTGTQARRRLGVVDTSTGELED